MSNVKDTKVALTGAQDNNQVATNLPAVIAKPSIDERLQKFHDLEKLKERREDVIEALEQLKDFHIAPTGGASVNMQDSKGKSLRVSHPIVVAEMIATSTAKLQTELAEIESQFVL